jgi:anti-sigma regulatory factor (Ser/Thr protein kinase)
MYATNDTLTGHGHTGNTAEAPQTTAGNGGTTVQIPRPRSPLNDISQTLEHTAQAAGTARHTTQTVMEDWNVSEETADAAVLVISELVTNAVEHAQAPLALHLHREHTGNRIWIGVSDGGPAPHHGPWTSSCTDEEHGRGLTIITMLTDTHGTHTHPNGHTTHWARLNT